MVSAKYFTAYLFVYELSNYSSEIVVWGGCSESYSSLLENLQIECGARLVTGAMKGKNRVRLLKQDCT